MINLLSPEQKRDIRAARINVMLMQYCVALVLLGLLVGGVYGTGFWIVNQEEHAVNERLASQADRTKSFTAVEKQADSFRQNLTIAKSILSKETSYSSFLITLARDIPSGAILTNLTVGDSNKAKAPVTIDARATSYAKILELKNNLEQSTLFEDVSIASATGPPDTATLTGIDATYPYTASLAVKLSTAAPASKAGQP